MTERMSLKRGITMAVLEKLPAGAQEPIDKVISAWWMTGRQDGLRLTEFGDRAFRAADIECFSHPLEKILDGQWYKFLLNLSKKIRCPYYIGTKDGVSFIRLFDSKIAMMVTLYGTFQEYLDSVRIRK